jgi:hypothetical protein
MMQLGMVKGGQGHESVRSELGRTLSTARRLTRPCHSIGMHLLWVLWTPDCIAGDSRDRAFATRWLVHHKIDMDV